MNVVDRTAAANPITKAKLANYVARAVRSFMQVILLFSPHISCRSLDNPLQEFAVAPSDGSASDWGVSNINFDKLYLLEFRHVSVGSWQPVLFYLP